MNKICGFDLVFHAGGIGFSLLTDKMGLSNWYKLVIYVKRTSIFIFICTFNRYIMTITRGLHDVTNESYEPSQLLNNIGQQHDMAEFTTSKNRKEKVVR